MDAIDRSILILSGREPFFQWVASLPDVMENLTPELINRDLPAILIPPCEDDIELEEYLVKHGGRILESILADWQSNRKSWPARRNRDTLKEWFSLGFIPFVLDADDS